MKQIFIIEHLEPRVWNWCKIEYKSISDIVGKENLWFTNIKRKNKYLEGLGKVFKQSVRELGLKEACVLDPEAKEMLTPKDSEKFKYFIFGGILGDYPPKKRTKKELTQFLNFETRHIGKKQFPTDNAVLVVKKISQGRRFEDMEFKENLNIPVNEFLSVDLPFLYVVEDGKPFIRPAIVNYLKKKKGF